MGQVPYMHWRKIFLGGRGCKEDRTQKILKNKLENHICILT
jgi:hypothetical protein